MKGGLRTERQQQCKNLRDGLQQVFAASERLETDVFFDHDCSKGAIDGVVDNFQRRLGDASWFTPCPIRQGRAMPRS